MGSQPDFPTLASINITQDDYDVLRPTTSRLTTDNPETMPFNVDKRVFQY